MVEFALMGTILLMLTVGVVDVGRGFFLYNAMTAGAAYGARWASVVGGTCDRPPAASTTDWCNQENNPSVSSTNFWSQPGNEPAQTGGTSCPTSGTSSGFPYYTVSTYKATSSTSWEPTTIIGAIAQHFDTTSSSNNVIIGALTPGFDLTALKACIELPWDSSTSNWRHSAGDTVLVYLYYTFKPAGPLFGSASLNLAASAQYVIE